MRIKSVIFFALLLVPLGLRAQLPSYSKYDNRIIVLAQVDRNSLKRILRYDTKYFYVACGEGVKLHDSFGQSNFYYGAAATSLPLGKYYKLGTSLYLMSVRSSADGSWRWSQRLNLDGTFRYKTESGWIYTWRERLQYTHRNYDPGMLEARNAFALRSKFQIKYQGFPFPLACYAFVELRNTLNKPSIYLNRVKCSVCAEWKLSKQNTLCLYWLMDYDINRKYFITVDDSLSYDLDEDCLPALGLRLKHLF